LWDNIIFKELWIMARSSRWIIEHDWEHFRQWHIYKSAISWTSKNRDTFSSLFATLYLKNVIARRSTLHRLHAASKSLRELKEGKDLFPLLLSSLERFVYSWCWVYFLDHLSI
jgi:hypothetical protein